MRSRPPTVGDVFELRVTLRHIDPPVWRALRVPAEVPLGVLHDVLQVAFGWEDSHLHAFLAGNTCFGVVDEEDDMLCIDERAAPLGAVARAGSKLVYRYDFGDGWEHEVAVQRVDSGGDPLIRCTGGARACPPEDCGGPPGYEHLLEVLANPDDEEHQNMKQWAPRRFDPEKFDLAAVNKKLATLSKGVVHRRP